jgi:hypothetical protein
MLKTLTGYLGDILAGSIKDERIALSREQSDDLRLKLDDLIAEANSLRAKNDLLVTDNGDLSRRIRDLEAELKSLKEATSGGEFVENMGTLWKRTADGFERFPYCKRCVDHPMMFDFGPNYMCDSNHMIPRAAKPPQS